MLQLSTAQIQKRGEIIGDMLKIFKEQRPWLITREELSAEFFKYINEDPVKLRIINGMAAAFTPAKEALC